jgi:hypothetical protein
MQFSTLFAILPLLALMADAQPLNKHKHKHEHEHHPAEREVPQGKSYVGGEGTDKAEGMGFRTFS